MRTFSTLLAAILLTGCATCERHPMACGVAAGIVVTSIAISVSHHHDTTTSRNHAQIPCTELAPGLQDCPIG